MNDSKSQVHTESDPADGSGGKDFPVVGIGASAGGIQALKEFFAHVPAKSGMAYVVILHLSPDHESHLSEVLQVVSSIPILQVQERVPIQQDNAYVVSPNHHLDIEDGHLIVTPNTQVEDRRAPIDIFFRTLAETQRSNAVCVVLSGTGADGSMGLKRVKERGGVVFVQNPREAEFNDMPRNAIATDLVDAVLNVAEIPGRIIAYRDNRGKVNIPTEPEEDPEQLQTALREIFTQLRVRTGHDFSNYKRATLLRRIERRINVSQLSDLVKYAAYIKENGDEVQALLKDLLISVTNFFRDKQAFTMLEQEIIPVIMQNKTASNQIRVWVAGCATGEEAYTLAMLLAERTLGVTDAPSIQIFATDIDVDAISTAREGLYTVNDTADISPDRLRRFFIKEGESYRARRELREMILFANHNVLKDPPFSHLDMVTCRNLLIYLNHTAQARVMETFHFALNPGGYLFLGNSESADNSGDMFTVVNKEHHAFQARNTRARRTYPIPDAVPSFKISQQLVASQQHEARMLERISFGDLHQQLLEQYAPPSVVVNSEYDIVHLSQKAGRYLQMSGGEPSNNLLKIIREDLRLELRSALYQAVQRQMYVEARNLQVKLDDGVQTINILVRPVLRTDDPARGFILVIFEPSVDDVEPKELVYSSQEPLARQLEEELVRSKTQLQTSVEQYEVQAEELRASNEELQAMNEELRSAAEELETSKEELQSINEELVTVNQELKIKIEELSHSNNNFQNLINSTSIGTIFLDRRFRVSQFSPPARDLFNLIPADIGRPISDITHKLQYDDLLKDAEQVLEKLQTVDREVESTSGRAYMMRILPYRTAEDHINGVVITLVDISRRKQAEDALRRSQQRLQKAIEIDTVGVIFFNAQGAFIDSNRAFIKMSGFSLEELSAGKLTWADLTPSEWVPKSKIALEEIRTMGRTTPYEKEYFRKDGSRFWALFAATQINEGEIVEYVIDITERKEAEQALVESELQFRTMADVIPQLIWTNEKGGNANYFNKRWYEYSGLSYEESYGPGWQAIVHPEDEAESKERWLHAFEHNEVFEAEYRLLNAEGTYRWHLGRNVPLLHTDGSTLAWFGTATDIEDIRNARAAMRESEERLHITMESIKDYAIFTMDGDRIIDTWNTGAAAIFGYAAEEIMGQSGDILFTPEDQAAGAPQFEARTALAKGRAADERWHMRKDGSRFFASGVMTLLSGGEVRGFVKIARDLTSTVLQQQRLRASEERYQTFIAKSTEGIWRFEMEDTIDTSLPVEQQIDLMYEHSYMAECNDAMAKMHGYETAAAMQNARIGELLPRDEKSMAYIKHFITSGYRISDTESQELDKNGKVKYFINNLVGIVVNGKLTRAWGMQRDITERKALERIKEDFIGIASHELRTPVSSIKAYVEILHDVLTEAKDEESAGLIKKLDAQVDRLATLVKDLLDATKISEGKMQLHMETFDLNELINETVQELERITKHQLVLNLVPIEEITGDRERIRQVVVNLLSNAIKYSPKADRVSITSTATDKQVIICVQDYGIGLSAEAKEFVFERFYRASDMNINTYPGLGLGLYIAADIVQRHGGNIWVEESKENQGSTFCFSLPFM